MTLIEVMLVIAILGVIAALALPAFQPLVKDVELSSAAESVASFYHRARMRALGDRRCTRVRILSPVASQPPAVLVAEVANVFDCGDSLDTAELPSTARRIEPTQPVWIEFARLTLGRADVRVAITEIPTGTGAAALANTEEQPREVRYRQTGRIYSTDQILTNDDGLVRVTNLGLPGQFQEILLEGHGPICLMPRNTTPPGSVNNRSCP